MAAHKNRAGQLLTSYACKSGDHGIACDRALAECDDVIVCHCSCHPDDGCTPTIRRTRVKVPTCSQCFLQHAGECY
jgi:hypothetical protein